MASGGVFGFAKKKYMGLISKSRWTLKFLLIVATMYTCSTVHAEENIQRCKIVLGLETSNEIGRGGETAVKFCSSPSMPNSVSHRLSTVWRSSVGVCHFLEEDEQHVEGKSRGPIPADMATLRQSKQKYALYSSFASSCGNQASLEYFPTFSIVSEEAIGKIRTTWSDINDSDEKFAEFSFKFDEVTGGASRKWRRNSFVIRFLDAFDAQRTWWQRLLGIRGEAYVMGFRDESKNIFIATFDVDARGASIHGIEQGVN